MKRLIVCLTFSLAAWAVQASSPLWMRDARISPDGKQIAFCYQGNIYTVDVQGGTARRLTTQTSYEMMPVWSSDGSYLENTQLEPDIQVANTPETIVEGEDTQLRTAVEDLLKEIGETAGK